MSDEDLELLVTMDDPGEDTLEEDTFHLQSDKIARWSSEHQQSGDQQQSEVIPDNDLSSGRSRR